ncbi:hypothetical protein B484DRAFT_400728, partial [Ochromonadaceae sp. CCMP2298]
PPGLSLLLGSIARQREQQQRGQRGQGQREQGQREKEQRQEQEQRGQEREQREQRGQRGQKEREQAQCHTHSAFHPLMGERIALMDTILDRVIAHLPPRSVLFLFGDHGMTDQGEHGGASEAETDSGLFVYTTEPRFAVGMGRTHA